MCVAALSACAVGPNTVSIRPGVTSDVDLDAITPPSGVTYRFDLLNADVPVPVSMALTSRRQSAKDYRYQGELVMTLPDAQNLDQIAKTISQVLGQTSVRATDNQLFIPIGLRSDNRFRASRSSITGDTTTTTEQDGIWRSKTVLDPDARNPGLVGETRRAVYSIDKNAVLIDMVVTRGVGARRSSFSIRRK